MSSCGITQSIAVDVTSSSTDTPALHWVLPPRPPFGGVHSAPLAILDGTVQIRRRAEDCLVCSVFVHCPSLSLTGQWGSVPHTRYPLLSTSGTSIVRNGKDEKCREPEYRSFSIANHKQHLQVTASSSIDTPTRFGVGPISSHDGEGKNIDNSSDDDLAGVHIVVQEGRNGHAIARMMANDINDMSTECTRLPQAAEGQHCHTPTVATSSLRHDDTVVVVVFATLQSAATLSVHKIACCGL